MKKQTMKNLLVTNNQKITYTSIRKIDAGKKTTRYIYTENDLGEGLLDMGFTPTYTVSQPVAYNN